MLIRLEQNDTAAAGVAVASAGAGGVDPTSQTVGNVTGVAVSGNVALEVSSGGDGARVVDTGGLVEGRDVVGARLVDAVGKAITIVGASSSLADHLVDGSRRARVLHITVFVTGRRTVMVLHEAAGVKLVSTRVNGVEGGGPSEGWGALTGCGHQSWWSEHGHSRQTPA